MAERDRRATRCQRDDDSGGGPSMKRSRFFVLMTPLLVAIAGASPALAQQARVFGTVMDEAGQPVVKAKVVLEPFPDSGGNRTFTLSSHKGSFLIGIVRPGKYYLLLEAPRASFGLDQGACRRYREERSMVDRGSSEAWNPSHDRAPGWIRGEDRNPRRTSGGRCDRIRRSANDIGPGGFRSRNLGAQGRLRGRDAEARCDRRGEFNERDGALPARILPRLGAEGRAGCRRARSSAGAQSKIRRCGAAPWSDPASTRKTR